MKQCQFKSWKSPPESPLVPSVSTSPTEVIRQHEHKVLVDLSRMSHDQEKAATEYLIKKELVGRKLDMLATKKEQLRDYEVNMTHMLKPPGGRRGEYPAKHFSEYNLDSLQDKIFLCQA
ncbi:hypothetical protein BGZ95_007092 [Linnemannia exigua]|uniref:Uncharacterized protein n=1 Tax=Linnemannia exigua TaxID=604196 RepID=A0AAD4HBW7_9FUNG|nr:hypothetical protein BGZ95_007092 [Linnemannia exigua]